MRTIIFLFLFTLISCNKLTQKAPYKITGLWECTEVNALSTSKLFCEISDSLLIFYHEDVGYLKGSPYFLKSDSLMIVSNMAEFDELSFLGVIHFENKDSFWMTGKVADKYFRRITYKTFEKEEKFKWLKLPKQKSD